MFPLSDKINGSIVLAMIISLLKQPVDMINKLIATIAKRIRDIFLDTKNTPFKVKIIFSSILFP